MRTQVGLTARGDGSGVVTVSVTFDRAAAAAIGDLSQQLRTSDLRGAGWTVGPPVPAPGGGETVTASQPFATPAQAAGVVAELAGPTTFHFTLARRSTLWRSETVLAGSADLRCGVGCFGDVGLTRALGSPTGVDPVAIARQAGTTPARALAFQVDVRLPGQVRSSDAQSRDGGSLVWTPRLGEITPLMATTRSFKLGNIIVASAAAAALLAVPVATVVVLWRRRGALPDTHPGAGGHPHPEADDAATIS